jgi:type I restriction enzyme M protein
VATNFNDITDRLWNAADKLRTNTHLRSSEYFISLLNLIFLKFADQQFYRIDRELRATLPSGEQFKMEPSSYKARGAIYLPPEARFDYLLGLPQGANIGHAIGYAMRLIEQNNEGLRDVLSIDNFSQIDDRTLVYLLNDVATILSDPDKGENTFGQIYEYFLNKFALKEGPNGGEFFTPASINRLLVEVIEPNSGSIFDPACGVGGIFVQSMRLAQGQHSHHSTAISIFGQENTTETVGLCKMNLAIHGLSGDIQRANSYYEDPHSSVGRFDFVISNPPFNANGIDKHRLRSQDHRFPFGIPHADNANYLWIQMFYSALNEHGRAGFVMPNSASDTRFKELEIRRHLIEERVVDVMISVGSNFFYPFTFPFTLWFLDKGKRHTDRHNQVLFIDARPIYRQLDRSHRDFSSVQIEKITNIIRLYRGEVFKTINGSLEQLQEIFPKGIYRDVTGLCKVARLDEIQAQNWSLNPVRYIGVVEDIKLTPDRNMVFISYSHKDKKSLERLNIHLDYIRRNYNVRIWDDSKIFSGDVWREEIKNAILHTKVAILLISADFLASKFIAEDELPPLLEAARKEGATILPIILSPCMFEETQLGDFQAVDSTPLSRMTRDKKEATWTKITRRVKEIMATQA